MLMTKIDALNIWCPMVRQGGLSREEPANRTVSYQCDSDTAPGNFRCIADKCAMWRWDATVQYKVGDQQPMTVFKSVPPMGYCGLAGKP